MLSSLKNNQIVMAVVLSVIAVPLAIWVHFIPTAILFGCILFTCLLNLWINCSPAFLFLSFASSAMAVWPTLAISILRFLASERYTYLLGVSVLAVLIAFIGGRFLCVKKIGDKPFLALAIGLFIAEFVFRDQLLYEPTLLLTFLFVASFVFANLGASYYKPPRLSMPISAALSAILTSAFFLSNFGMARHVPNLALIDCFGRWAETKTPFTSENITLQSGYSYSLMKEVLRSRYSLFNIEECSTLEKTLAKVDTAIIITPTTPLQRTDVMVLDSFIARGGRLVIIADHTDLYGHGRVINGYLNRFDLGVSYDVVFEPGNYYARLRMPNTTIQSVRPKSACSLLLGCTGFVFAWADKWISEAADYNRPNFFGEMAWTSDDSLGTWPVGAIINKGKGTIVLWGDSTIFANFCIFQPENLTILGMLIEGGYFLAACKPYCTWLFIIAFLALLSKWFGKSRWIAFLALALTLVSGNYHLWDFDPKGFFPNEKKIDVYCDKHLLDEPAPGSRPQEGGFSSAYSHIPRCGLWPFYRGEKPEKPVESTSIWITPWREINKADDSALGSLCRIIVNDRIPRENPIGLKPVDVAEKIAPPLSSYFKNNTQMRQMFATKEGKHTGVHRGSPIFVAYGALTDRYIGDWWITTDISPYRRFMLEQFFSWLTTGKDIARFPYPDPGIKSGEKEWLIRGEGSRYGRERMDVRPFEWNPKFVYFGAGVWSLYEKTSEGEFLLGGPETSDDWLMTQNMRWGAQCPK